jgi:rhodanese-related sulfurtransferase
VDKIRGLLEEGAEIIDVREWDEWDIAHIKDAKLIPLSELRKRLDEIPKDKPVYLHCRSGQRSYNAALALQNLGYTDVYNISGGFIELCFYEYYMDKTTGREAIVSAYDFV